jgi:hypothetical protein
LLEEQQGRFMLGALKNRVISGLEESRDKEVIHAAENLAALLVVLARRCVSAREYGISIERILNALEAQPRIDGKAPDKKELLRALKQAEEWVLELNQCLRKDDAQNKPGRAGLRGRRCCSRCPRSF